MHLRILFSADVPGRRPFFAQGVCLFAVSLWLGAGDLLLEFALEDRRFFELATDCRALSILEDPDPSLPQPETEFDSGRQQSSQTVSKGRTPRNRLATALSSQQSQTCRL